MKIFAILTVFLLSSALQAAIILDVTVISKRGMGKGLILETELQESAVIHHKEVVSLELSNGVIVDLSADFDKSFNNYGPSDKVIIKFDIYNERGEHLKKFNKKKIVLAIGDRFSKEIPDGVDHLIELNIIPRIR